MYELPRFAGGGEGRGDDVARRCDAERRERKCNMLARRGVSVQRDDVFRDRMHRMKEVPTPASVRRGRGGRPAARCRSYGRERAHEKPIHARLIQLVRGWWFNLRHDCVDCVVRGRADGRREGDCCESEKQCNVHLLQAKSSLVKSEPQSKRHGRPGGLGEQMRAQGSRRPTAGRAGGPGAPWISCST
jgi:hypothetical protein